MAKRPRVVSRPPSKTGCKTCRIRKIKCDETKPSCTKCTSTGRTCDGYRSPKSSDDERPRQRTLLPSRQAVKSQNALARSPKSNFHVNDYEGQAFQYFTQETAIPLWAISPTKDWIRLALQQSHTEPVVFSAIAAVGAINSVQNHMFHQTLDRPEATMKQSAALQQYCKATSSLQRFIGAISVSEARQKGLLDESKLETIILSCILFVTYEILQGRNIIALSHLHHGRSAFKNSEIAHVFNKTKSDHQDLKLHKAVNQLLHTLDEIESDSISFDRRNMLAHGNGLHQSLQLGSCLSTLEEAKASLESIIISTSEWRKRLLQTAEIQMSGPQDPSHTDAARLCAAHCLGRTIPIDATASLQHHELISSHDSWLKSFEAFQRKSDYEIWPKLLHMRIQHAVSAYVIRSSRMTALEEEDSCESYLTEILSMVGMYLVHSSNDLPKPAISPADQPYRMNAEPQRGFSLEYAVLPALYLCCIKLRSPEKRQQALKLLESADRREGIHWSRLLAWYAEGINYVEDERPKPAMQEEIEVDNNNSALSPSLRALDIVVEPATMGSTRVACARFVPGSRSKVEVETYQTFGPPPFRFDKLERRRFDLAHSYL